MLSNIRSNHPRQSAKSNEPKYRKLRDKDPDIEGERSGCRTVYHLKLRRLRAESVEGEEDHLLAIDQAGNRENCRGGE